MIIIWIFIRTSLILKLLNDFSLTTWRTLQKITWEDGDGWLIRKDLKGSGSVIFQGLILASIWIDRGYSVREDAL
jgi:hypothetical protein